MLVAFNSILQIVLYSPFAILYIDKLSPNAADHAHISYATVARSVAAFLGTSSFRRRLELGLADALTTYEGIPLALALLTRGFFILIKAQKFYQTKFLPAIAPLSLIALIFTTIIIFAGQGKQVSLNSLLPPTVASLPLSLQPELTSLGTGRLLHHRRLTRDRPSPCILHHHVLPRSLDLQQSGSGLRTKRYAGFHWRE